MNIYIASSWKNQHAVELLTARLRGQGHEVVSWIENNYGEDHGPDKPLDFEAWVKTPAAERSFQFDVSGAMNCDLFIYMSPGGKDAAAECGAAYAASQKGQVRFPLWMLWAKGEDFGLMRKMFDRVFTRAADLLDHTERIAEDSRVFDPA